MRDGSAAPLYPLLPQFYGETQSVSPVRWLDASIDAAARERMRLARRGAPNRAHPSTAATPLVRSCRVGGDASA